MEELGDQDSASPYSANEFRTFPLPPYLLNSRPSGANSPPEQAGCHRREIGLAGGRRRITRGETLLERGSNRGRDRDRYRDRRLAIHGLPGDDRAWRTMKAHQRGKEQSFRSGRGSRRNGCTTGNGSSREGNLFVRPRQTDGLFGTGVTPQDPSGHHPSEGGTGSWTSYRENSPHRHSNR